jgi:hypothetical protein
MTSTVTGDSLTTQIAISAEQKRFLAEVVTYYRELAGEQADDEQARARTAAAAFRVGYIEYRLGHDEEGVAAFRQAQGGYAGLAVCRGASINAPGGPGRAAACPEGLAAPSHP